MNAYIRLQAASVLGLGPNATEAELKAAITDQLELETIWDLIELKPETGDPIYNRKIAAAQLLMTATDSRQHSRRMVAFCETDSHVPENRKVFRSPKEPVPGEQLALLS